MKIEPGKIYVVAGQGEMKAKEVHGTGNVELLAHGNVSYWSAPSQIVREATAEDVRLRSENAKARGVDCTDPECWCKVA